MIRIVSTLPFAPPEPPVNALPVVLPPGLTTGVGPVAPFGTGNAVPLGETIKSGALSEAFPTLFVARVYISFFSRSISLRRVGISCLACAIKS